MSRIALVDPNEVVGIRRSSNKKSYYAQMRDGRSRQLRSVTAALGVISKDEALMRWAINLYSKCLRDMAPVGKVLTEPLLTELIEAGSNEFERVRYDAAEVGTRAHNLIHDWLRSQPLPPLENEDPRVVNALKLFWSWWEGKGLKVVESEFAVFNAAHGYAGTLDFICELPDGRLALLDWKTSKEIYPEMYLQVAAYYYAMTTMPASLGGRKAEEFAEVSILRIGKEDAHFEPAPVPLTLLPTAYRAFYCCLQLLEGLAEVKSVENRRWAEHRKHVESLTAQKEAL